MTVVSLVGSLESDGQGLQGASRYNGRVVNEANISQFAFVILVYFWYA